MGKIIFILLLLLISIFNVISKIEEDEVYEINIDITGAFNDVGLMNTLILKTNLSDPENYFDPLDISKQFFDTKFIDKNNDTYNFTCNLWKSVKYSYLTIFCDLIEKPEKYDYNMEMEEYIMNYNNKKIKIFTSDYILIFFTDKKHPFLYSVNQTINLDEEKDVYNLKFNVGAYYDKNLFLDKIQLDDCKVIQKEMTCKISKNKLENIINPDNNLDNFNLFSFSLEYEENYYYVSPIIIKHEKKIIKKDIYVNIIKLLNNDLDRGNYITFETDINNFPIIEKTRDFDLNFTNVFYENQKCFLKKNDNSPLLLLCELNDFLGNNITLKEIDKLNISNIHLKYNFILSYSNKNEYIRTHSWISCTNHISLIYPQTLDFTKKENLNITIYSYQCNNYGLSLNPKSQDLKCSKSSNGNVYNCLIPKNHFDNLKNGFYYLYHDNNYEENYKTINYEVTPFKVIFTDDEEKGDNSEEDNISLSKIIIFSVGGCAIIIIAIIIIVVYYFKKKRTKDKKPSLDEQSNEPLAPNLDN